MPNASLRKDNRLKTDSKTERLHVSNITLQCGYLKSHTAVWLYSVTLQCGYLVSHTAVWLSGVTLQRGYIVSHCSVVI